MNITRSQITAFLGGAFAAALLLAGIYFGSGRLERFDQPLAAYAAATVFAAFGITYRYLMWLQRPPTWQYFRASWRLFFRPRFLVRNALKLIALLWSYIITQKFIEQRSVTRWLAHMGIAWGCLLAFAVTFPLSWGWIHFDVAANGHDYVVKLMNVRQMQFDPNSVIGFLFFHVLDISSILILGGMALAMRRRMYDHGAQAVQSFAADLLPLFLLFSICITGLMLTASQMLMGGAHYSFISLLHAFTVIITLLYFPFGKFFHVIQRPAQIGVAYYKQEGEAAAMARCARSGQPYQTAMHHDDLSAVMRELGFDFGGHQDLSPEEKRKLIALNQAQAIDGQPYVG